METTASVRRDRPIVIHIFHRSTSHRALIIVSFNCLVHSGLQCHSGINQSALFFYWEELLMLLVGCDWDTDGEAEQICGAVFQPRSRGHKMAVWISKGDDEETIIQIGRKIKERLHFPDKIYFHTVEDQKALVRGKDITTGRYVL
ncbi:hypothetical protein EG68_10813 [Paragonimus skrjabini miyazakii]|uniref:Eukaryotic translation initiation factor 4E n=1 Tax=Paragonimus skrjabini miyazakii TaxID=59628 RepID=A0A8S9YKK8_9TREM|nr:hypothetical protein EG68_10813 [Paragonimus skrjabini miyazakii]